MKKVIVFFIFIFIVFFVSGKKLATFDNIYKPYRFQVKGDDLYVVDGSIIKLFSMKDFKLITQFGKKGEGPGEFKNSPRIMIFTDHVFVSSSGKINFFTRDGELIKEKRAPGQISINKVKDNYLHRDFKFNIKKASSDVRVKVLDKDFQIVKEISKYTYREGDFMIFSSAIKKKLKLNVVRDYFNAVTDGNFIYIGNTTKGFFIEIYDYEGKKIRAINKKYDKLKISDKYKKSEMDSYKRSKNWERDKKMFDHVFPEYFPAFEKFKVNNGKIYVFKHIIKEKEREIIILDLKGNILKKTFVPDEKYYNICNNKYYYFVDNEDDEVMEFHSIDL